MPRVRPLHLRHHPDQSLLKIDSIPSRSSGCPMLTQERIPVPLLRCTTRSDTRPRLLVTLRHTSLNRRTDQSRLMPSQISLLTTPAAILITHHDILHMAVRQHQKPQVQDGGDAVTILTSTITSADAFRQQRR